MKQFSLEEYLTNPNRKIVTRDGHDARIICTDAKNGIYPIIALVDLLGDGVNGECSCYYNVYGVIKTDEESPLDLFFAPEKHEGWVNMYRDSNNGHTTGAVFDSQEDAERVGEQKLFSYVTTVKIEWEE